MSIDEWLHAVKQRRTRRAIDLGNDQRIEGGLLRMISLVVMAVLGRVHNDGRPAMGLMPVRMLDVRFGAVIRSPGIGTRRNRKRRAKT
jgi:hypothetical protein